MRTPLETGGPRRTVSPKPKLIETITHLAFYSRWPKAMSAITIAKEVFKKQ